MVPGIIGNIQALEVLKIILGFDDSLILTQRMVFFDGLSMKFRNVKIRGRNKDCITCGEAPTLPDICQIDYFDFCKTNCNLQCNIVLPPENTVPLKVFAEDFKANPAKIAVVDVRPPVHYGIVSLPGSVNIPFRKIEREEEART